MPLHALVVPLHYIITLHHTVIHCNEFESGNGTAFAFAKIATTINWDKPQPSEKMIMMI